MLRHKYVASHISVRYNTHPPLLTQLHKLHSHATARIIPHLKNFNVGHFLVFNLICNNMSTRVWMQYFYHLWYDHFTHRKMTFINSNIGRGKNSSFLPICFATFRAAMTSVLPSIPIENV